MSLAAYSKSQSLGMEAYQQPHKLTIPAFDMLKGSIVGSKGMMDIEMVRMIHEPYMFNQGMYFCRSGIKVLRTEVPGRVPHRHTHEDIGSIPIHYRQPSWLVRMQHGIFQESRASYVSLFGVGFQFSKGLIPYLMIDFDSVNRIEVVPDFEVDLKRSNCTCGVCSSNRRELARKHRDFFTMGIPKLKDISMGGNRYKGYEFKISED